MDRLRRKFVWPDKCYCIGVNVAPIVEMLNVSPVTTRAASLAQVSDQSPRTFNESLLAASKASSSAGTANQAGTGTGRRQKPVSQDAKPPPAMPHVRAVLSAAPPQKMVQQQVLVAQQPPLINPALIPMQLPLGEPGRSANASTVAAGQPMRDVPAVTFLPIESKLVPPVVAKSDSVPSSHAQKENDSPQTASVLPLVPHVSQTATNLSNAVRVMPRMEYRTQTRRLRVTRSRRTPGTVQSGPSSFMSLTLFQCTDCFPDAVQKAVPTAVVPSAAPSACHKCRTECSAGRGSERGFKCSFTVPLRIQPQVSLPVSSKNRFQMPFPAPSQPHFPAVTSERRPEFGFTCRPERNPGRLF